MAVHHFMSTCQMPRAKHRKVQVRWRTVAQDGEEVVREVFLHVPDDAVQAHLATAIAPSAGLCHAGDTLQTEDEGLLHLHRQNRRKEVLIFEPAPPGPREAGSIDVKVWHLFPPSISGGL